MQERKGVSSSLMFLEGRRRIPVDEQNDLLEEMVAQAEVSVKELFQRIVEQRSSGNAVGLEWGIFEAMMQLGATLLGMVLTAKASEQAAEVGTRLPCKCGGVARWVERRTKTILTVLGKVTYGRVYYHCRGCEQGENLGDRGFGLEHTRTSLAVKQLLGYLSATTVGYAVVAENVCRTLLWPRKWLSGKQVQRLAIPLGKRLGEVEVARIARLWSMATAGLPSLLEMLAAGSSVKAEVQEVGGEDGSQRLYVQMDGIMVRIRGALGKGSDVYREVKVGAVFWAERGRRLSTLAELAGKVRGVADEASKVWIDRRKGAVSYVAGLIPAASFGVRLYAEGVVRGLERAREVVVLGDGARWIWELAKEHFPEAIQILDFWHAKQRLWEVGYAVWGKGSPRAKEWVEKQIEHKLIHGDVAGLVAEIAMLPKIEPPPGEKKSIPEQAMEYYQNNAERMDYPQYRARGLEIGSGVAESSGRRVVGLRCKVSGMRWSEEGVESIIDLRTHVLNNRYDAALAEAQKVA
jgi:hypothetical protein